jgi:hypothetical protein
LQQKDLILATKLYARLTELKREQLTKKTKKQKRIKKKQDAMDENPDLAERQKQK